ncbi:glucose dehydrogenase [FAD, quinone]-like [Prorops nasuta]|uniref:glucose dehydrogenase [FAD, quinone]-like n=1 Tax=Prorops nasuta TaxID=863751 RepID=UPI0034CE48DE
MEFSSYEPDSLFCSNPFFGGPQLTDVCPGNQYLLFFGLLNALVSSSVKIADPCGRINPVKRPLPTYDYIVVGGGAAGPTVAARLSEVSKWKVLLVEAGPDEPAAAEIPSNLQLFLGTELDFNYTTTNESHACLGNGGKCKFPRGRNLGGCTVHHGMAYHRGHAKDYERWVDMGNKGWSYDEVMPYYLKSEDNREIGRVSSKYHARGGPMTVERFPWQPPFAWDILKAAEETGYGVTEDMVGDKILGFTVAQTISRDGVRLSSSSVYLRPIKDRPNLHVALDSPVTQIIMRNKKAVGVRYVSNGVRRTVMARKEIILTAGSINSPQLLLLSGIGPKEQLKSQGIRVVHDLPGVGENLHNHASFGLDFALNEKADNLLNIQTSDLYLYNQTGPLSGTGLAQVTGIVASNFTTKDDPDIQIFFAGYQATCPNTKIADLQTYNDRSVIRMTSVNIQTRSRGRLTLKSKDPLASPVIWSNELSNPEDPQIILQGLKVILKLANSTVMQEHGLTLISEPVEECKKHGFGTDQYWICAIQWKTRPENHQSGTCRMGPSSDPLSVVDPELKVHGIENLRVADASIMPQVVSGNPVAAIVMIGERVADFIKKDEGIRI